TEHSRLRKRPRLPIQIICDPPIHSKCAFPMGRILVVNAHGMLIDKPFEFFRRGPTVDNVPCRSKSQPPAALVVFELKIALYLFDLLLERVGSRAKIGK